MAKVFLIGAGPGDPSLLTLKAVRSILASDVVVYDDLVNPKILEYARPGSLLVQAGKRAGRASASQDWINRLLVEHARRGRTVARLKGGDPFIFGRGGEEAEALVEAGVAWEIVPGISAGHAVAAYSGIPLTHRDLASSVAFITGHDASVKAREEVDWRSSALVADTLVIFMCAKSIASIARRLIDGGRDASTPIAVVRWGTYDDQQVFRGTLADAAGADGDGGVSIEPPAIAIVGDVVSLRDRLAWFDSPQSDAPFRSVRPRTELRVVNRKEEDYDAVVA